MLLAYRPYLVRRASRSVASQNGRSDRRSFARDCIKMEAAFLAPMPRREHTRSGGTAASQKHIPLEVPPR